MKSRFFLSLILITTLTFRCSEDDEPEDVVSPAYEFFNSTHTPLYDSNVNGGITDIPILVNATGTIRDKSKVTLEFYLQHNWQTDLGISLIRPDGREQIFVYRVGSGGKYIGNNLLRFNSEFTDELPNNNVDIPAGNYKETEGTLPGVDPNNVINLEPIFSFLEDANINGTWRIRVKDHAIGDAGNLLSCKLLFAEGALDQ